MLFCSIIQQFCVDFRDILAEHICHNVSTLKKLRLLFQQSAKSVFDRFQKLHIDSFQWFFDKMNAISLSIC